MPKLSKTIQGTAYWNNSSADYYFGRSAQYVLNRKHNSKKKIYAVTDCSSCSCGVGGCGSGGGCDGY